MRVQFREPENLGKGESFYDRNIRRICVSMEVPLYELVKDRAVRRRISMAAAAREMLEDSFVKSNIHQ